MEEALQKIMDILRPLSEDDRAEVLSDVGDYFCPHCGREHPDGRRCQCWNDE